ncbi:hypothetical protein R3W88_024607 [Solanum pinnatisectum]|uniref:Retrotransposon Copia-like N-terminal domain-containing protein n=1 Tax=Solanum pinnatisectum TaxID=50273 RepID=A0AAV9M119_9SOLN|nr:hypothetical protein R3W88_024607 [Solanum pinnatisectum]
MTSSSSSSLSLSAASLHQLIAICPIKLKPSNYLIWKTQITQLMQTLKVGEIIVKDPPYSVIVDKKRGEVPNPKEEDQKDSIDQAMAFQAQKTQGNFGRGRGNSFRGRGQG